MAKTRKPLPLVYRDMNTRLRSDTLEGRCPDCGEWQSIEDAPIHPDGMIWFVCMAPSRRCMGEGPRRLVGRP